MNKLMCLLLACVAFAVVAASSASFRPGSVPVVAWSNYKAFNGNTEFLDSLNDLDFGAFLAHFAGKPSMKMQKLSPFLASPQKHEIVVVFGASQLRTDAFALAASNEELPSLQASLSQAFSSLIAPYLYRVSDLSQTLEAIARVTPLYSVGQNVLENAKTGSAIVISAESLEETVTMIASNGILDVLYVPVSEDSQIAEILSLIGAKSYVAIYTSDVGVSLAQHPYDAIGKRDVGDAPTFANRWPAYIFQFLLISLLLLVILFAGCICTSQIQTPTRYEIKRVEQIQ